MAGYSGKSLSSKLGIKDGFKIFLVNSPKDFEGSLEPLPKTVSFNEKPPYDFIHLFTKKSSELNKEFPSLKAKLVTNGLFWISWPKKSSQVETDLDENIVREVGLR